MCCFCSLAGVKQSCKRKWHPLRHPSTLFETRVCSLCCSLAGVKQKQSRKRKRKDKDGSEDEAASDQDASESDSEIGMSYFSAYEMYASYRDNCARTQL